MANSVNAGMIGNGTNLTIPTNTTSTSTSTSQIYISNGSSGSYNTGTTFSNSSGKEVMKIPAGDKATVKIIGTIEWNGEDLEERLERIESMLHIPTRDVTMEEKYQKLKRLWEEYKTALEEYKTWQRLKDSK
jgi:hypothetical protein